MECKCRLKKERAKRQSLKISELRYVTESQENKLLQSLFLKQENLKKEKGRDDAKRKRNLRKNKRETSKEKETKQKEKTIRLLGVTYAFRNWCNGANVW